MATEMLRCVQPDSSTAPAWREIFVLGRFCAAREFARTLPQGQAARAQEREEPDREDLVLAEALREEVSEAVGGQREELPARGEAWAPEE